MIALPTRPFCMRQWLGWWLLRRFCYDGYCCNLASTTADSPFVSSQFSYNATFSVEISNHVPFSTTNYSTIPRLLHPTICYNTQGVPFFIFFSRKETKFLAPCALVSKHVISTNT
jgi:hypothetical protein